MENIIANYQNVRFVPPNNYSPIHEYVSHWIFPYSNDEEEIIAIKEAQLADAVAKVASDHGLNRNDLHHLFPYILRMLKSKSQWSH